LIIPIGLKKYVVVGLGLLFIFQSVNVTAQNTGYDSLLQTLLYTSLEKSANAALDKLEHLKTSDNNKEERRL